MEEGGYAWLTLNYLLGKLGAGPEITVAAIDMGGGSVQVRVAFGMLWILKHRPLATTGRGVCAGDGCLVLN